MTQVQENSSQQHVVLLATTSSQSIIAEIVDGKTNAIGYTAYGEQSAQQEVVTQLGFNGQLRETKFGWYLLGNGYRAYNPRLMRFHSPDSLSPFGEGGLNAYMYCGGEPVMNSDPTGHVFGISDNVFSLFTNRVNKALSVTPTNAHIGRSLSNSSINSSTNVGTLIATTTPTLSPAAAKIQKTIASIGAGVSRGLADIKANLVYVSNAVNNPNLPAAIKASSNPIEAFKQHLSQPLRLNNYSQPASVKNIRSPQDQFPSYLKTETNRPKPPSPPRPPTIVITPPQR